jgi:tripartite-type tricarboxylate transporter receptor subunit TctC
MRILLAIAAAAALLPAPAPAQPASSQFPSKPIRIIVGPGPDALARLIGEKLTQAWGQPVLVEQRGGGGGTISAEAVAKAPADGYTLLLATGTHAINPLLYKTAYDIVRDFAPVTLLGSTPFVLAVHPSVPAHSVAELIALAKARPGKLNYGSGGNGTPPHLATELFKSMAGIDIVHVMFTVGPAGLPQIRAGRIRGLAVSTAQRSAFAPELPTVAESGLRGFEVFGWNGLLAPAGTPQAIIDKLHDAIIEAMREPELRSRIAGVGFEPIGNTPGEFGEFLRRDVARWAKVVKESGARVD